MKEKAQIMSKLKVSKCVFLSEKSYKIKGFSRKDTDNDYKVSQ